MSLQVVQEHCKNIPHLCVHNRHSFHSALRKGTGKEESTFLLFLWIGTTCAEPAGAPTHRSGVRLPHRATNSLLSLWVTSFQQPQPQARLPCDVTVIHHGKPRSSTVSVCGWELDEMAPAQAFFLPLHPITATEEREKLKNYHTSKTSHCSTWTENRLSKPFIFVHEQEVTCAFWGLYLQCFSSFCRPCIHLFS